MIGSLTGKELMFAVFAFLALMFLSGGSKSDEKGDGGTSYTYNTTNIYITFPAITLNFNPVTNYIVADTPENLLFKPKVNLLYGGENHGLDNWTHKILPERLGTEDPGRRKVSES